MSTKSRQDRFDKLMRKSLALHQQGAIDRALEGYREALRVLPDQSDALHLMGVAFHQKGAQTEAIRLIARAIAREQRPLFWFNLAKCHDAVGDRQHAEGAYQRAIELQSDYPEALENLANLRVESGRLLDAIVLLERVVKLRPDWGRSWRSLARLYSQTRNNVGARAAWFNAYRLLRDPSLLWRTLIAMPSIYRDEQQILAARDDLLRHLPQLAAKTIEDPLKEICEVPFAVGYHHVGERELLEHYAETMRAAAPILSFTAPHCARLEDDRGRPLEAGAPMRVGFVSASLRDHSVTRFYGKVVSRLPMGSWHVTVAVPDTLQRDRVTDSLLARADSVIEIPWDLREAQGRLAKAQLELLVYTDLGMDPLTYYLAFSRLAPLQVALPGHPLTTGIDSIDFFLGHAGCEPDDAQAMYTERLCLLPDESTFVCCEDPGPAPAGTRAEFGLPEGQHVYLCAQMLMKIHPRMDRWFREILNRDAEAILALVVVDAQHRKELEERFQRTLAPFQDRVTWLPFIRDEPRYRSLLRQADVLLDTWPFSGGRSSFDAFAVAAPVVTLPGPAMRGRQTAHLYRRMGITGLIATDADDFVRSALKVACDRGYRDSIRERIAERRHHIFNDGRAVEATHRQFAQWVDDGRKRGSQRADWDQCG